MVQSREKIFDPDINAIFKLNNLDPHAVEQIQRYVTITGAG
jgi:hypothetical protein